MVRIAINEDLNQIKKIWKYCFGDSDEFMNYYFENKYKAENTLLVEDEDIIASLGLNQYKIKLNNKEYDASYVVGVSTLPNARGNGCMKHLMKASLREMYSRNQLISILMPIDYRLYRGYGFEHCYDNIEYKMRVEELKEYSLTGSFEEVKEIHVGVLKDIYESCMKGYNGNTIRDGLYYETLLKEIESENGYAYLHKGEHSQDGYILYSIVGRDIIVREMVYKDIFVLKSFLKFLYNHNTQISDVIINLPLNNRLNHIISNLKNVDIRVKPFMMGRIINFKELMEGFNINKELEGQLIMKVKDNYIDENNKSFKITFLSKGIKVDETLEKEDLEIDINLLTQLFFSYIDIEDLKFMKSKENISERTYSILGEVFSKKINYINEYV